MKNCIIALCLLGAMAPAGAEPAENAAKSDELYSAILKGNSGEKEAFVAFLKKTTHFRLDNEGWQRMLETGSPYSGVRQSENWARGMLQFFEANGYPGLRKLDAATRDAQIDKIAQSYSFNLILDGPGTPANWKNFCNYWGQLYSTDVFHWGWLPKSGQAAMTLVASPSAKTFSASADGKVFRITTPITEVPTSQWSKNVDPVLERYNAKGKRP